MVLSTAQSRYYWAPACRDYGKNFGAAYKALDSCFRKWGYKVGYGSGAYNCRTITGGSGYSLHAYPDLVPYTFWNGYRIPAMALAVDINPPQNPYSTRLITNMPRTMVTAILAIRTNSGHQVWGWGGYYTGTYKDAMHYEIVCTPAQLATGIRATTAPTITSYTGDDDMTIRIGWITGEPTAAGDQTNTTAAHLIVSAKDKGGKTFDIKAYWLSPTMLDRWRYVGVDEVTTRVNVSTFVTMNIPIHGGPFKQVGLEV